MLATTTNKLGKIEKNAKVKAGQCIFPFKYKRQTHSQCVETDKGDICATQINDKTGTLTKYGYCLLKNSLKKSTQKKTLSANFSKKLKSKSKDQTKVTIKSNSGMNKSNVTMKKKLKGKRLKIVTSLKPSISTKQQLAIMPKVYNEEFINVLEQLSSIMQKQGEPFRARAYQKAQEAIMVYPGEITNASQLSGLPGIGKTILNKLEEYEKTGTLAVLEREKNNPINVLTNIYGVGPKKAKQLIEDGLDSLEKIKKLPENELKKVFNKNQLKGLEYYDDINQKIPRAEIDEFDKVFGRIIKECCGDTTDYEIVGSYRRGKMLSGDIDMIITNKNNDQAVFDKFLDELRTKNILEYTFSKGTTKSLTMCRLNPKKTTARRVDFLYTSPSEFPFAILYFTGSKIFNTVMRQKALSMGYTLNEHGLSYMKGGVKGEKVEKQFNDEKDIFDFLNMVYKSPEERIDGRAVMEKIGSVQATIPSDPIIAKAEELKNEKIMKKVSLRKTIKKKQSDENKLMSDELKRLGVSYLDTLTEIQLMDLIIAANDAYYNKKPFLSDDEFDIVKEYAERKYPENNVLKAIGAPVEKGKVLLPFNMPSMNKIKPDSEALTKWKSKFTGPYVLSAKLDGVSGMYVVKDNENPKLYTRGDGTYGQDISHLIPYLRLPQDNKIKNNLVIRGEFIIKKKLFETKYSKDFSNPRNFVAGIINSKTKIPERYLDLDFVAYEMIVPSLKPSVQFDTLSKMNIDVVNHKYIANSKELTNEMLSKFLVELRDNYDYEIDGVIVADDKLYERTPENPEHAFAFKMVLSDQVAEVKVLDVLWSPSKDGYLKPRVQVEPVVLGGAKIEFATGFNAKFIEDNRIGIGAVIELVRSGDVIPHILRVVKPAEKPLMPDVPWKWNDTHVDALLVDKSKDETVIIKTITLFFKNLDTAGMGPGYVTKLVAADFNTLPKIIHASEEQLQKILGKKTGQTAFMNISNSIKNASLPRLMAATNIFGRGFGERKIASILEKYPNILLSDEPEQDKVKQISSVKGMSKKTSEEFVEYINEFIGFLKESKLTSKLDYQTKKKNNESHILFGKKIVMTGFRDKELMDEIEELGGQMTSSVSNTTFAVLVKDKEEDTGKAEQARKLGIQLLTPDEFKSKYLV